MRYAQEIAHEGVLWVNISRQNEKELGEIQKRFGLLKADILESLPPFQRPKMVKRDGYYFIVLHFPVFDRETRRLGFTEVDFFMNASYCITIHDGKLAIIDAIFSECKKDESVRAKCMNGTATHIFFEILNKLFDAIFPILLHVSEDINKVDKKMFDRVPGTAMAEEILRLKTNVVTFRRTMQGHRTVLERFIMSGDRDLNLSSYQQYINSVREYTTEIWHMLESQNESINALHETNESILSLRTNEIMKTLTIISVITFPLTLLATIFAIHAPGTPFIDTPFGFWIYLGLAVVGAIAMGTIFKKKGWI